VVKETEPQHRHAGRWTNEFKKSDMSSISVTKMGKFKRGRAGDVRDHYFSPGRLRLVGNAKKKGLNHLWPEKKQNRNSWSRGN